MGVMPDQGMPGEVNLGPGPEAVNTALSQGYTYNDVADYANVNGMDAPPRPSLEAITSGQTSDISQWSAPTMQDLQQPGRDAINEGAGPVGEAIIGLASGGLVKAAGEGIAQGVLTDVSGSLNPRSLVQATTEELTPHMSELDLAAKEVTNIFSEAFAKPGVKTGAAIGAGYATLIPASSSKE